MKIFKYIYQIKISKMKKRFFFLGVFLFFLIIFSLISSAETPTITANATKPDTVYTNTSWELNITATDSENSTLTSYTQFYVNGTASGSELNHSISNNTNTNVANLSSTTFNKGATLIAEMWASDVQYNSSKKNSTQVTVQNLAPTQPSLTNPANNSYTNTIITTNWTASSDADDDTVYYYILVNRTQACYTSDLNCSYSSIDGYYQWNVTPYDGTVNGTTSDSRYYAYDITPPIVSVNSSEGTSTTASTTIISGIATDSGSGIVNVTINGVNATNLNVLTGAYSLSVSLDVGSNLITVIAYDQAGNSVTNVSLTVTRSSTPSGGGGGGSSVSYEQKSLGTLAAGSSKKITFLESDTHGITEIEIKVKNRVTNAKIRIDTGSLPSGAPKPSTKGSVYKYIEITKVDITDDDIEKAVIQFKVKKSWLTEKGYGIDAVILHRYYNKKWDILETKRVGFGTDYYYYSAESLGFSTFAITAEKAPAVKPAEKITEEKVTTKDTEKNVTEIIPEEEIVTQKKWFNFSNMFKNVQFKINWKLMSIIIVVILTAFFVQKKWNVLKISVGMESEAIIAITGKMEKAEKLIKEGDIDSAKKTYRKILKIYDGLPVKERKWVYKEIQSLYNKIKTKGIQEKK